MTELEVEDLDDAALCAVTTLILRPKQTVEYWGECTAPLSKLTEARWVQISGGYSYTSGYCHKEVPNYIQDAEEFLGLLDVARRSGFAFQLSHQTEPGTMHPISTCDLRRGGPSMLQVRIMGGKRMGVGDLCRAFVEALVKFHCGWLVLVNGKAANSIQAELPKAANSTMLQVKEGDGPMDP